MEGYENLIIEKDGPITVVTLNRPKALNALNSELLSELDRAVDAIAADSSIHAVIFTGAGNRSFVAGADIKEMVEMTPIQAREFMRLGHSVLARIESMEKPTIAAVNGFALGGGLELAISCDIRYATENARFGLPEVGLGVHPGFGGTIRLPRLIGRGKAAELLFSADQLNASQAAQAGLVQMVVPCVRKDGEWIANAGKDEHKKASKGEEGYEVSPDNLMETCKALAGRIAANGPVAVKLAKSSMHHGLGTDHGTALNYEVESVALTFSTKDLREGMTAFIEKRKPEFKGE